MALLLIPDMEDVVGDYLRNLDEITDIGAKVVGLPLGDARQPWVLVSVLDSPRRGPIDHLIEFFMQFSCYAGKDATVAHGGQAQVNSLARTVRAALNELPETDLSDVVVSGVEVSFGPRLEDDTVEPARQHLPVEATIWAHAR